MWIIKAKSRNDDEGNERNDNGSMFANNNAAKKSFVGLQITFLPFYGCTKQIHNVQNFLKMFTHLSFFSLSCS